MFTYSQYPVGWSDLRYRDYQNLVTGGVSGGRETGKDCWPTLQASKMVAFHTNPSSRSAPRQHRFMNYEKP